MNKNVTFIKPLIMKQMKQLSYFFLLLFGIACSPSEEEKSTPEKEQPVSEIDSTDQIPEIVIGPVPDEQPEFLPYHELQGHPTCLSVKDSTLVFIGSSKNGLYRLEGGNEIHEEPRNSEMGYLIRTAFTDSRGESWISSSVKKERIMKKNGTDWEIHESEKFGWKSAPTAIFEAGGEVYFGGVGGVMDSKWNEVDLPIEDAVVVEGDGNQLGDMVIIAYAEEGQFLLIRRSGEWTIFEEGDPELALGFPKKVKIDEESTVYANCWKGLVEIKGDRYEHYQGDDMDISDFSFAIEDMDLDDSGRLWMCGEKGLIRLDENGFERLPILDENERPYRLQFIDVVADEIWLIGDSKLLRSN